MSSAAEAEIGAMYFNAREAVPSRQSLHEMGHHQPRTPMQTDKTAAHSIVTNNAHLSAKKPWTCVFIGYDAATRKTNSNIIGGRAAILGPVIGPSISQHPIT